jgi:spore cortex biosynthesis protein YabQ
MNNQAYTFIIFIINGIIIGFLFDCFRIIRKSFKTSDIITYIEDILFWIIAGITTLYFIFIYNNRRNTILHFFRHSYRNTILYINN